MALQVDQPPPGDVADLRRFDRPEVVAARQDVGDAICAGRVGGMQLRPVGPVQAVRSEEIVHSGLPTQLQNVPATTLK
jgi:hypothetical protein